MRYPKFLEKNGRIGFIAPSYGCTTEPYQTLFENTKKVLADKGYKLVFGPNCYAGIGIGKSNTPNACGDEINDFFIHDNSDVIISCGGGETMCEDLPYVDFDAIAKANPKWYMGYSDNTNLTFTLPTLCDTAAIYGPCASSFGMNPWHESIGDAFKLLHGQKLTMTNYDKWEIAEVETEENLLAPYNVTEPFEMIIHNANNASFSGRLLGGCLDCLNIICGTKFDKVKDFADKYANDGIVWFIEACELNPMGVRRVLWQLDEAGWFKSAKGFLIGRPMQYDADGMGFDRYSAVTGILEKYNVPILMDLDIGHLPPMMPLISGAMADVEAKEGKLKINMRLE